MVTTFVRAWHSIVLSLEEKQWSLMSWAWLDSTDSWIQTCKSMAFLGIVAFKLLLTLAALSRKELYFAGGGNNYWMWWHSRWETCYLIQVINLSSLLLPSPLRTGRAKITDFFFPHQVSAECHDDICIYWNPMALPYLQEQRSQDWTAFTHSEPAGSTSLPGEKLPEECLLLTHFNPRTPIPRKSNPQNSTATYSVCWISAICKEAVPRTRS